MLPGKTRGRIVLEGGSVIRIDSNFCISLREIPTSPPNPNAVPFRPTYIPQVRGEVDAFFILNRNGGSQNVSWKRFQKATRLTCIYFIKYDNKERENAWNAHNYIFKYNLFT